MILRELVNQHLFKKYNILYRSLIKKKLLDNFKKKIRKLNKKFCIFIINI